MDLTFCAVYRLSKIGKAINCHAQVRIICVRKIPRKALRRPAKPAKSPRQRVATGERFGTRSGPLFESAQRHSRFVLKGIFPCMPLVPTPALPTSYATGWASASLTRMMVWRLVRNSRATEATEWPSESFWRTMPTCPLSRL